ncbi:MAG: ribonuclease J [Erysipelotrichaceae bacterium]|nr:ribonuclease J [Erysipelotrichaceae bacterium]
MQKNETYFFALGGLEEVGKNTYCVEHEDNILLIDAGVMFPEDDSPGVDYIVPDYSYLVENQSKIKGLLITHGHEDHIGGLPFLLQNVEIPTIYAPRLAAAFIRHKLAEFKIKAKVDIIEIDHDSLLEIGCFKVSCFNVTHSIPDSLGFAIDTPNGRIVTTGDFKMDLTPVGKDLDYEKITKLSSEGIDLLVADSTNAEVEGYSISESAVVDSIHDVFRNAKGRLIVATFASNVHRIQQIIEASVLFRRKIMLFGRSMDKAVNIGREIGYIKCPDNYLISPEAAKTLRPDEILIFCTGTQGEPMAALSRIAFGQHRQIKLMPGDTVVFSSSPIPGNTASVNKVINQITRSGVNVLTNSVLSNIHASGHAYTDELKMMLKLMKPKYFAPIHGEYRMLKLHTLIAKEIGMQDDHLFVLANGKVLALKDGKVYESKKIVHTDDIYVDGNDITGLSTAVIKDRKILASEGLVAVLVSIDPKNNRLLSKPAILSRGFIYIKERTDLIIEAEKTVNAALEELLSKERVSFSAIKNTIKTSMTSFLYSKTRRNPMIIPVIMSKRNEAEDSYKFVQKENTPKPRRRTTKKVEAN